MKFSIAFFAILTYAPVVLAAPMKTCSDQAECLDFTIEEVNDGDCSGDCEFRVCMTVNQSRNDCTKTGSISHTCEKDSDGCTENGTGFKGFSTAITDIGDGYSSCQTVTAGDTAEFLMKDGNGVCATGGSGIATCKALEAVYPTEGSCTGNVDKECIWMVIAPTSCSGSITTSTDTTPETGSDNRNGVIDTAGEEAEFLCA